MQYRALFAIIFSLLFVSCGGDDVTNGTDGNDGNSVLVESSAAEDDCSVGGTTLTFGYDTTGDGEIDDVLTTETICEGEDGAPGDEGAPGEDGNSVLTETTPADVADCPNGGTTVTLGYDTTGDDAIDQVLETANACNGAPGDDGEDGADGEDGNSVLVETATADAADCPAGGTTATFGYDTTGDDAIDQVLETETICNGIDGDSVLVETAAAATTACPADGTTVTFGYDTTGDGAIDQTLETTTVCDGADGEDGNSVLVESAPAAAGACPADGTTFTFGYDTTGDSSIDQTIDTTTICDGEQGPAGDPADELTVERSEATTCLLSGTTFTFGYDTTGDGSIDTVVDTVVFCDETVSDVLYYNDNAGVGDTFLAALQSLDSAGAINLTVTSSPTTELGTGNYDVVVFSRSNSSLPTQLETALTNWVNGGGAAIFSHYSSGASIFATFEATTVGSNLSTATFNGPLGRDLGTVAVTNANNWGTYSLDLQPTGSATSGCSWSSGDSCAVIGNGGRTVVLGFLMDTISQANADLVIRNSLVQVLQ